MGDLGITTLPLRYLPVRIFLKDQNEAGLEAAIMKSSQGSIGRVFIIRLEDGDIVPECIERFALENGVKHGHVVLVGGLGEGKIVVGPFKSNEMPPEPMVLPVDGAHEVVASGVIAPDESGRPVLHVHGSLGRAGRSVTGCLRPGVQTWLVGEVVLYEILGATATRRKNARSGFTLLEVGGDTA